MWTKSSKCDAVNCAEVDVHPQQVRVRNNQVPGDTLAFDPRDWAGFLSRLKGRSTAS